ALLGAAGLLPLSLSAVYALFDSYLLLGFDGGAGTQGLDPFIAGGVLGLLAAGGTYVYPTAHAKRGPARFVLAAGRLLSVAPLGFGATLWITDGSGFFETLPSTAPTALYSYINLGLPITGILF